MSGWLLPDPQYIILFIICIAAYYTVAMFFFFLLSFFLALYLAQYSLVYSSLNNRKDRFGLSTNAFLNALPSIVGVILLAFLTPLVMSLDRSLSGLTPESLYEFICYFHGTLGFFFNLSFTAGHFSKTSIRSICHTETLYLPLF